MHFFRILRIAAALLASAAPVCAQPIISEFMAQNDSALPDADGEYSDWLELHNPGPAAVNLDGYYLTDDAGNLTKWRLPAELLPAGGYLVIFASGKNRTIPGTELHTNFALDADGEFLALIAPDGSTVVSGFAPLFPRQYRNISYGSQTAGVNPTLRAGQPGYLIARTPGAANTIIPGPHPLYCDTSLARLEITASQAVWNGLQAGSPTSVEGAVNIRFRHGDIDVTVTNVGISARGNTSLNKYPRSFNISFNSFVPGQNLFGIEKLNLNSEANDPSTARSKLCFDLANAAGLPTPFANHVATVIVGPDNHRPGPDGYFFDAVLNNTQPVDDVFLRQRFANDRGNLYKCNYRGQPANLLYLGPTGSSYTGQARYELKHQGSGDGSFNDLASFINMLNNTPSGNFATTIRKHFEVDDFLKRLALDVLTANWDGYWGNYNNYYLYRHPSTGKWHYIPYDKDNTFSIQWITPSSGSWATQNIYNWGHTTSTPLAHRILGVTEFRNRYSCYLNQMLQTFYQNASLNPLVYRIRENQTAALPFNDLGIANAKSADRARYSGDWPNWTYSQYFNSYDQAQAPFNGNVPNHHGITEFITARRNNALSQLNLTNIGPIISQLQVAPVLPTTNQPIVIAARVEDNVSVSSVRVIYQLNGGTSVTNTMTDSGTGADAMADDKIYTAQIGPFATGGTVTYYVQATDNVNKSTFEPWGGATDQASLVIGSPFLNLAITELNYHPHDPTGGELLVSSNPEDYEFIEFQNLGSTIINLNGVQFIAGITYTFPTQSLAAGQRIVLVKNVAAFTARYGGGSNISGPYDGQLSNSGEELHLVAPDGVTIHQFTYADAAPWPERADGRGCSIELINPAGDYNDPARWRDSISFGGTPGEAGVTQSPGVVINEILTHTDPPLSDSIELHNPTDESLNIGGWYLSDSDTQHKKYHIPDGTILPAGGYITFTEAQHFNTSGGIHSNDFALNASQGETLWLLQGDAQSNLVAFVDYVSFGAARNGESFGRWPNGAGELYPMLTRTFGTTNSGPRVGPVIISELMYHPPAESGALEFVEVFHPGPLPENLTNWKLTGAVDYSFPTNLVLLPGQVLVVLPLDPDAPANAATLTEFRARYGVRTNAMLLGPYQGALANEGEVLRLRRPDEPLAEEPTFIPMLLEDEVSYLPTAPWPMPAAGAGAALVRRSSASWGNDAQSWVAGTIQLASPGTPPGFDEDEDGLPDDYERDHYGDTSVVGAIPADADGDGLSDAAEYVAGTSATNAASAFTLQHHRSPEGHVIVSFPTQPIVGPGYYGQERRYALEQTTNWSPAAIWSAIPGYENLPATGSLVTFTNLLTNDVWSARARVWLQ